MKITTSVRRRKLAACIPFALVSSLIFFLSDQSSLLMPAGLYFTHIDKVAHLTVFAILGASAAVAVSSIREIFNKTTALIAITITTFYGALDEAHQYFVPNREVSFGDFTADTVGALIGVFGWLLLYRKLIKKDKARQKN